MNTLFCFVENDQLRYFVVALRTTIPKPMRNATNAVIGIHSITIPPVYQFSFELYNQSKQL